MAESDTYEFHCPDCDTDVVWLGNIPSPPPTRCGTCQWVLDHIPEHERAAVRALINKDG